MTVTDRAARTLICVTRDTANRKRVGAVAGSFSCWPSDKSTCTYEIEHLKRYRFVSVSLYWNLFRFYYVRHCLLAQPPRPLNSNCTGCHRAGNPNDMAPSHLKPLSVTSSVNGWNTWLVLRLWVCSSPLIYKNIHFLYLFKIGLHDKSLLVEYLTTIWCLINRMVVVDPMTIRVTIQLNRRTIEGII